MCGRSRGWGQLSNDLCQGGIHADRVDSVDSYEKSGNVCLVLVEAINLD